MKATWIGAVAGLIGLGMGTAVIAQGATGPTAFVTSVLGACAASDSFSTLGADASRYYAPETLAIMGVYAHVTPPGEVGVLGADPICSFRAYREVTPRPEAETVSGDNATVSYYLDSGHGHGPGYEIDLVRVGGNWRIRDVTADESTGLLRLFSDATQPTPEAFLQALYAHYTDSSKGWRFTPLNENASAYFDPDMVALMAEDRRVNGEGNLGAIDADPICSCQDYNGIKADIAKPAQTADTARVTVRTRDTVSATVYDNLFTYDLVRLNGMWRIHDIHNKDVPSLRDLLITSNKAAAAASG